eukprot:c14718_g2_i1 orf=227-475(-)
MNAAVPALETGNTASFLPSLTNCGAYLLCDMVHISGLAAAKNSEHVEKHAHNSEISDVEPVESHREKLRGNTASTLRVISFD